jgi:para-aminobenzoate synthetase component 1
LKTDLIFELDYPNTPHAHYQNLINLPGFVLLESVDKQRGRYDIISAYPFDTYTITNKTKDLMKDLEQLKTKLSLHQSKHELPFQGGAIGYLSYDLGAYLQGIKSPTQPELATVPLAHFGFYDWAITLDHYEHKAWLFLANQHESTEALVEEVLSLWRGVSQDLRPFVLKDSFSALIPNDEYIDGFLQIHQELRSGRAYQVNYTQAFHAFYEGDAWEAYHRICKKNPVPFAAFMRLEDLDVLSFSPERFLLHEQGRLLTSPIKGTISRSADETVDNQLKLHLMASEKDRAENVMIVDLLRNDLGKIARPGTVKVLNLCQIQSYSSVHHLVSDIEAIALDEMHPLDYLLACFPGGSITGAPKREAMHIINEREPYGRGIYCGSIVYCSTHGRLDSNIAIRTITANNNILHLAAGGGIVIDSVGDDEYRECFTKIEAIINGLK